MTRDHVQRGIKWGALGVTAIILLSLVLVLIRGDGTSDPVPYDPIDVQGWLVCPSIARSGSRVREVERAVGLLTEACIQTGPVTTSDCTDRIPPGFVEIRSCPDQREGFQHPCEDRGNERVRGAVAPSDPDPVGARQVVYIETTPLRFEVLMHEMGHAVGFGHTPRASSYMHAPGEPGEWMSGMGRCP